MPDRVERTIDAARRGFNDELLSADYPQIHGDAVQVDRLVDFLDPRPGGCYLDLATGNGDVAFAVAGRQPAARVLAIDIADRAVSRNRRRATDLERANVEFHVTDGRRIDFPDATFDGIACRYAFHHLPDVAATLADVRRVLRPAGVFVVADAVRHPLDDLDFINRFQALKPDGHVRMHTAEGLIELFRAHDFEAGGRFASAITFNRDLDADHRKLIAATPPEFLGLYDVKTIGERVVLTFDVLIVKFLVVAD
ncbi:MAG: methyltransferase domain-containing protein [Alphaproteobacteria bacterium]|jgi:SAM-dependent methyltransferase|nr:methyltransferase domain-containing protein [Alphaproteobacteria bacterium]MDP6567130.1 methyltransferase domain-containing protein [Alphaproteobacteria bacterium]MDP6813962.1 methyltransferase domain-containing protein [Alphaproteobacteria bacterium]